MKEIYFKSFGYKTKDGKPAFGCIGVAVHYNNKDDLKVVKTMTSVQLYKNIKHSEEATIVAGLDIFNKVRKDRFTSPNDQVSFCITSSSLQNYYDQYFDKNNMNQLLSNNQVKVCQLFNSNLDAIKNELNIKLSVVLGIRNQRTFFGMELLSKIEDDLINRIQKQIDVKKNWVDKKKDLLNSEIEELSMNQKVLGEEYERMTKEDDYWTEGTSHDEDYAASAVDVFHKNVAFNNAEALLKEMQEDITYIPTYHHYF